MAKQEGEEGEVEGGKKREGEVGAGEGGRGESSTMAGAASVIALDRGPYGVDLLAKRETVQGLDRVPKGPA